MKKQCLPDLLKKALLFLFTLLFLQNIYTQEITFIGFSSEKVTKLMFDNIDLKLSDTLIFNRSKKKLNENGLLIVNIAHKEFTINSYDLLKNNKNEFLTSVKICFAKRMCYVVFVFNRYHNCSISLYLEDLSGKIVTFGNMPVKDLK